MTDGTGDSIRILGLEHLNLLMPEGREAAARAFYGDLLGLPELPKPEGLRVKHGCWFSLGAQALHLGAVADFVPASRAHPAFLVADLEGARRQLQAAGVEVRPDTQVAHVRRFYVSDPFGNRLEFIQQGDSF